LTERWCWSKIDFNISQSSEEG